MPITSTIIFVTSTMTDGNMSFRFGGDEESVRENREKFVNSLNTSIKRTVCMSCDHGEKIVLVDQQTNADQHNAIEAEVLITQETDLALMLLTADCLPTGFYDPVTRTIALAHFSRETIANGLPGKTVNWLQQELKVDATNLQVFVGPHIHKASYSFPLPLSRPPNDKIAPFSSEVNNHIYIDLPAAHNSQLTEAGVNPKNISLSEVDTFSSSDHFSHFESVRNKQRAPGRMMTVMTLLPSPPPNHQTN